MQQFHEFSNSFSNCTSVSCINFPSKSNCSNFTNFRICSTKYERKTYFRVRAQHLIFITCLNLSGDEAGIPELVLTGINFPSKTTLSLKGRFKRIFPSSDASMSSPSYFDSTFIWLQRFHEFSQLFRARNSYSAIWTSVSGRKVIL